MKNIDYFKNEFIDLKIELETLVYNNNLKKELFEANRFFNFATVNFLDFKTFQTFKVIASENFYDNTKEVDNKIFKSTTKHQLFFLGNKDLKKDRYKDIEVIEKIEIGYKIIALWNKFNSLKQELQTEYYLRFSHLLAIKKLIEMEELKKEKDTYFRDLLKKVETEDWKEWSNFINELENERLANEKNISQLLSDKKRERNQKKK